MKNSSHLGKEKKTSECAAGGKDHFPHGAVCAQREEARAADVCGGQRLCAAPQRGADSLQAARQMRQLQRLAAIALQPSVIAALCYSYSCSFC